MNIRQAYIETKSAKKKAEHIPPTGFLNIQVANNIVQVRNRAFTEQWTSLSSNRIMYNSIGNYKELYEINSLLSPQKPVYYVTCGWDRNSSPRYVIYISEMPFMVVESDWRGESSKWNIIGELFEDTGLYIAYSSLSYFTNWLNADCTPKNYGQATPAYFMRQIANDYLGG